MNTHYERNVNVTDGNIKRTLQYGHIKDDDEAEGNDFNFYWLIFMVKMSVLFEFAQMTWQPMNR